MRKISDIGELYDMICELFVEAVCPKCENIVISTMSQAEMVLIFGCANCADIEQHMLTQMNVPIGNNAIREVHAECIN